MKHVTSCISELLDPVTPLNLLVSLFLTIEGQQNMSPQNMEGSTLLLQEGGPLPWSESGPSWHKDRFELLKKKKKKAADIGETLKTERLPFTKGNLRLFYIRKGTCTSKGPVYLPSRSVMSNSL